jgi:hypothetical protein
MSRIVCKIFLKSIGGVALSWKIISYYICVKTYKTNRFLNILTKNAKISHRKALEEYLFSFITPPLVTFPQIFLSYVPLHVIVVLMIRVSYLCDLQGPSLWRVTHTDRIRILLYRCFSNFREKFIDNNLI